MKTLFAAICLALFLTGYCPVAAKTPAAANVPADNNAENLFYNSVPFFSEVFLPVLTRFEKAKIETTLRGFYMRADTHPGFGENYSPSDAGIYLDVAVRDPEEIAAFRDTSQVKGEITWRTVELPAPKNGEVALRVTFAFGSHADAEAVSAVNECIGSLLRFGRNRPGTDATP